MPKTLKIMLSTTAVVFAMAPAMSSAATLINFESGYSDNQLLSDPIELLDSTGAASGVTLSTVSGGAMSVEKSGNADTNPDGFVTDTLGTNDTEVAGAGSSLGDYFLRATSALSGDFSTFNPVFTLTFGGGAAAVSAEIWDIDGLGSGASEQWEIKAYDAFNTLLGSLVSPLGTTNNASSLDGKEWAFSFSGIGTIDRLDFVFTGTKTSGIGVAFDNLQVSQVPLPASALLLLGGLGGLAAAGRRRRKAT